MRNFTHLTDQNLHAIKYRAEGLHNKVASNKCGSGRDEPCGDRWYRLSYNLGSSHPSRSRNWQGVGLHSEEQNITSAPKPFRVCPACGQLTPSNEAQCIYCGALSPQAVQEQEERRFFQALFTRATPITYGLVAINVIYYFIVSW